MRDEVVVYRSPVEAFYWDNPEYVLWIIGGGILVIGVVIIWSKVCEMLRRKRRGQ